MCVSVIKSFVAVAISEIKVCSRICDCLIFVIEPYMSNIYTMNN